MSLTADPHAEELGVAPVAAGPAGEPFLPEAYAAAPPATLVTLTVDGIAVRAPKGTLVIRVAEQLGIDIPRFCDHPLLDPVGACRQCLVAVEGQRKPLASCTTTVSDGMVVRTQRTSEMAEGAQRGNLELLLVNHPLDCPICDKGGECPLQNQAMTHGPGESRFRDVKRTYVKVVPLSSNILLDRERCVLCARCTRFSQQIAGDPFIELFDRGALEQVAIAEGEPLSSYFSGNTVQICPVGALTSASYRFQARPFDLVSTPSVCEHCASGCDLRTDTRRGQVKRRLAGENPDVNEEWSCDKGRFAFAYATQRDRITRPMVRDETGELVEVSWPEALERAAEGLTESRDRGGVGVLVGGRATVEDAYAYAKFARVALATNDVDMRARPHSAEESDFLAAAVVGRGPGTGGVTYADLERAPAVMLVGLEPEEESPIIFLRLRKASRRGTQQLFSVAPYATEGLVKSRGKLLMTAPGGEAAALAALRDGTGGDGTGGDGTDAAAAEALHRPGAVILVGERLAEVPGALSAAVALAAESGASLAWVPRRAGERGAVEAGALPGLLPGGRRTSDPDALAELAAMWGVEALPTAPGRGSSEILAAAASGELSALVVGGVDPADLPDPELAATAMDRVGFLVSLEVRASAVTARADVVFPVAPVAEKAGTFLDWEGRTRRFDRVLGAPGTSKSMGALPDLRVLDTLALEMGADLALTDVAAVRAELGAIGTATGEPGGRPVPAAEVARPAAGEAVLATWHLLLDDGRLQDGEPNLAGTRRPAVARLSAATAAEIGVADGGEVTVSTGAGRVTVPVRVTAMPERCVWLPTNTGPSKVRSVLRAGNGSLVSLAPSGPSGSVQGGRA